MVGILTKVSRLSLILFFAHLGLAKGITPSVLMFHEWDLNACKERVEKSLSFNRTSIHLLLAGQFIAKNKKIESFCYNTASHSQCAKIDHTLIQEISQKLTACMSLIPKTIDVYITIHLNDSKGSNSVWRNEIIFNPNEKKEGVSYKDFLITPFLKASKENELKSVHLSLQGEMGATIFSFPGEYQKLIEEIKKDQPHLKLGISLNYNKVSGGINSNKRTAVQSLLNSLDFLGFSAYAPISRWVQARHFKNYVSDFTKEMKKKNLVIPKKVNLIFSEIGLGGGNWINDGKTPGKTVTGVAGAPYAGIYQFNGRNNPWSNTKLKRFRHRYYLSLKRFLDAPDSPVKSAHIWNAGSWDIHGIYPGTDVFQDLDLIKKL